jgi:GWxTD domain-containing protein
MHNAANAVRTPTIALNSAINFGGFDKTAEPWLNRVAEALDRSLPWALAVWFIGVIALLGRLNLGLFIARRMKSDGTQPVSSELQLMFQQLSARLGISRPTRLLNSALVQAPTVVGWLRPVVLIPLGCFLGLSTIQVEAILAHELAHIRRHDYLVSVVQSVVEALLFYHPAVWWVSRQLRTEREHCCDDLAVRVGGNSLAYARALSSLEEYRSSPSITALSANGGVLSMRIRRTLGHTENPAVSKLALLMLLAVLAVAAGLCIDRSAHAQPSPTAGVASDATAPLVTLPTTQGNQKSDVLLAAYQKWMDEDVVWIITPQEKEAFMQLRNDQERDHFIEQFWLRRDLPGSSPNSYRTEHYQRIAYANQHFAANGAGWKTDRGHIYIAYGKPNEIESHAANSSNAGRPTETWRYYHIAGVGENVDMTFVDVCSCGDFRLQPRQ